MDTEIVTKRARSVRPENPGKNLQFNGFALLLLLLLGWLVGCCRQAMQRPPAGANIVSTLHGLTEREEIIVRNLFKLWLYGYVPTTSVRTERLNTIYFLRVSVSICHPEQRTMGLPVDVARSSFRRSQANLCLRVASHLLLPEKRSNHRNQSELHWHLFTDSKRKRFERDDASSRSCYILWWFQKLLRLISHNLVHDPSIS